MGIPFSRWGARPFIIHPIPYPANGLTDLNSGRRTNRTPIQATKNPVQIALEWRALLDADDTLNMSNIAAKNGISRARVTQIMNLLNLPKEILHYVSSLVGKQCRHIFSERNLRQIASMKSTAVQLAAFNRLRKRTVSES